MAAYESPDFYQINGFFTTEQLAIQQAVRQFVNQEILPHIETWAEDNHFPQHLLPKFGALGLLGPTVDTQYGGGGLDYLAYGLIMQEIERADSGMRSTVSVQGALVMYPIEAFGNEEQKRKYLPRLAQGTLLGCFGLTEPNHGSDPAALATRLTDQGDYYLLNGAKMWISNAPHADIAVVWAKDENARIKGVLVERGMSGFSTPTTTKKWSLRASSTGELVFDNVRVPKSHILPNKDGLGAPLLCLDRARYGIAWGALGAAMACYDAAKQYALTRQQFGRPIAQFQLTQKKLAEMLTQITQIQLLCWRLGGLMNEGKATTAQISMAKRQSVYNAIEIARAARQIHGAMGISGEFPMMRHIMNLESVLTYEGTHEIHLLILGHDITGLPAFA